MTTPFQGSPLVEGSQSPDFNPANPANVVTTSSAALTVYAKANILGQTNTLSQTFVLSVCNNEQISLNGPSPVVTALQKGATGAAAEVPDFSSLVGGLFSSSPTNTDNPLCNQIVQ